MQLMALQWKWAFFVLLLAAKRPLELQATTIRSSLKYRLNFARALSE
jgi:hypothetical protein